MIPQKFQGKESNYSGNFSHVPSQPAVVRSPWSMLSRDSRMPFDSQNLSQPQGNVFGNPRPVFDPSQTLCQGILHSTTPSSTCAVPVQVSTGRLVARGEERTGRTTTIPISERRPSTMNSYLTSGISAILLLDSKDYRYLSFSSINSHSIIIFVQEKKIQNPSKFLFRFSLVVLWIKEVEMVGSMDELKSSRTTIGGEDFLTFELLDARTASALNKIIQIPLQKEGQSGGTGSSERWSVSSKKTDRLHDVWRLSSDWRSWNSIRLCGFILCHSSQRRCSGLGYEMGWNSTVYDEDSIGWCSGKSVQYENTRVWSTPNCIRNVRHGNSSKDIDAQLSEVENLCEKQQRSETSITKFWRQKRENWDRSSGFESQVNKWFGKRKRNLLSVESKRSVFERRPLQFPTRESWSCKTDTRSRSIFWATNTKRLKCVEKKELQSLKPFWEVQPTAVQKLRALNYFDYWHPLECQFFFSETRM